LFKDVLDVFLISTNINFGAGIRKEFLSKKQISIKEKGCFQDVEGESDTSPGMF
jgi:hypothetical protein